MWDAEVSQVQLHIGLYAKSSYRGFLVAPYDSVTPVVRLRRGRRAVSCGAKRCRPRAKDRAYCDVESSHFLI